MDAKKIIAMYNTAVEFIDRIIEIKNNFINRINSHIDTINEILNNAISHSMQYIEIKLQKFYTEVDKILATLQKKIDSIINQLEKWYDKQLNIIKTQIILFASAKLGFPMSKVAAQAAAEAIPHPALSLPDFDLSLNLPTAAEILSIPTGSAPVQIPRIPI